MTRTMYDSVDANAIPTNAPIVGGYVDGLYVWSNADWNRFPHSVKVRIAVFADTNDGHVLDVESGNATPTQAPSWVRMRRAAGVDPTIYCSQSWWGLLQGAFDSQNVPQPHYWIANYDDVKQMIPGAIAKQYADDQIVGAHYDLSIVADYWPGVDPTPPPTPELVTEDDTMILVQVDHNTVPQGKSWPGWFVFDGTHLTHVPPAQTKTTGPGQSDNVAGLGAAGLKQGYITYEFWAQLTGAGQ